MDKELIAYFDERFREMREESGRQFERIEARLDKREEAVRHTQILVEGLRGDSRQLAEGIIGVEQRMEDLRGEFKVQFEDVKGLLRPSYAELDRRITKLEVWRETKERDPMDIIRERYGRKAEQ